MPLDRAMRRAKVMDYDLQRQVAPLMAELKPLPSIYYPDFIAANQEDILRIPCRRVLQRALGRQCIVDGRGSGIEAAGQVPEVAPGRQAGDDHEGNQDNEQVANRMPATPLDRCLVILLDVLRHKNSL